MHIALDQDHSHIQSGDATMWEHAKVMTEATPRHSFCRFFFFSFFGIPVHPSKIWQVPIKLWRENTMYMHHADCHLEFLLLGQEEGRLPRNGNLPVKLIQHVASQKKGLRKNEPD